MSISTSNRHLQSGNGRLIESFLEMMSAERGARQNTLDAYRRDLNDYGCSLPVAVSDATPDDIRRYLRGLDDAGMAASTTARRLSAVRQFHRFLFSEGYSDANPATVVEGPTQARALPKVLTHDQVDRLLAAARDQMTLAKGREKLKAARLHCLVELLYASGLRVSELVSLTVQTVKADDRLLTITGKGGRERLVPLSEAARGAIGAYLRVCKRQNCMPGAASPWLFPGHGRTGHLSRQQFGLDLKELAVSCGARGVEGFATRAQACFCQPSSGRRCRSSCRAADARSCGHIDHANLYSRAR